MISMKNIVGPEFKLIDGDALTPESADLLMCRAYLAVGNPVPEGFRVLTGNPRMSDVVCVAYRYEFEEAMS